MNIKDRIKIVRTKNNLSQRAFAEKINISGAFVAQLESGTRTIKDIHITAICREFNVNEHWLRTGEDEMYVSNENFSLDEYAKERGASDLDLVLIKCYLDMPKEIRATFMDHLQESLSVADEIASTKELLSQEQNEKSNISIPIFNLDTKEGLLDAVAKEYDDEKNSEPSASQDADSKKSTAKKIS